MTIPGLASRPSACGAASPPDAVSPSLALDQLEHQAAKTQAALQAAIEALEKMLAELPQLLTGTPAAAKS